ncbi:MAG: hypothetical protein HLUCCA11_07505 [Phormidesmis priestleyi Ana]|uniref:ATP-dependent Zn protease n=1 Tax=Phormidesmis priestleyi Ana TaxID=1666911 RepID=A0A0P7ZZM7_9CYAN|nr:MAG: hypothetical protein HLUCCA11_07505 [Phormidesmis priestleyi Ana]
MNPITLNLLAVSVFAFTLLSLVGPLLNISPAAIAIALTGCAGIVALDRFSWQNKGSNLLIDLLSSQSSEYRQRILHHEAGHFLAAHLLGIPVESYTLSAWQGIKAGLPGLGGVVIDTSGNQPGNPSENPSGNPSENTSEDQSAEDFALAQLSAQQVNRYSIVWMAGIAAETQTYGNAQGGDDDKAQLRQLWAQLPTQSRQRAAADTQLRWALLQANTLLQKQRSAYEALVKAMATQASVAVCCEQIEAHRVSDEASEI